MSRDMLRMVLLLLCAACAPAVAVQKNAKSLRNRFINKPISVSAFNVRIFGLIKMSDKKVADIITKIVRLYDVILIQEVRDSSGESCKQLWQMVNASDPSRPYGMVISERLGRSTSKEKYMYLYRLDRLELLGVHQYNDGPDDIFEREPYSVLFMTKSATRSKFALAGVHIKPDDAVTEIGHLYDVYLAILSHWKGVQNVLIMGDFNADCSCTSEKSLQALTIYSNSRFDWLIGTEADNTTSDTDCAYDRFIAAGTKLRNTIVSGTAGVYHFENDFRLD